MVISSYGWIGHVFSMANSWCVVPRWSRIHVSCVADQLSYSCKENKRIPGIGISLMVHVIDVLKYCQINKHASAKLLTLSNLIRIFRLA